MTDHANVTPCVTTPTDPTGELWPVPRRGQRRSGHERRQLDLGPPDGPAGERRHGIERRQRGDRRAVVSAVDVQTDQLSDDPAPSCSPDP